MAQTKRTENGSRTRETASTEQLESQIEALKTDIAGIAQTLKALTAEQRDEAIGTAKAKASETRARAEEIAEETVEPVRRRPGLAIGLAVGLGLLAGYLGRGRR